MTTHAGLVGGNGSEQHPWSVLRINDDYDMLRALDHVDVTSFA